MQNSKDNNRRDFLKKAGLLTAPFMLPGLGMAAGKAAIVPDKSSGNESPYLNFLWDGHFFSPEGYIKKLEEINSLEKIQGDYYGKGGPTTKLEEEFARITGKEKAIYMPSGTMANQLAMKLLNGENTKVVVPENSHIYRDEGDAAQSVHELRLIPLGKDKAFYNLEELKEGISYNAREFHYESGLGTVVIENPVRRVRNRYVPFETIKEISTFCREAGYKLHLDGARLHIASAFSGVSVAEYSSYFDTVYISLYKYLNAGGGAVLCGDAELIDKMEHQIKILGGSILRNWAVTAMAFHYLPGVEERWKQVVEKANLLIPEMNKIEGLQISPLENGTNSYKLELTEKTDSKVLSNYLVENYNMIWAERGVRDAKDYYFVVNETLLMKENEEILSAWRKGIDKARQ